MALERLVEPRPLTSNLTNWYLGSDKIPPPCPQIYMQFSVENAQSTAQRRRPLTVGETHSLYLIPAGTLDEPEKRVNNYREHFSQGENPLKLCYGWDEAREEHAKVRSPEPQWVLIPSAKDGLLAGSRKLGYKKQAQMVGRLRAKSLANYQIPTLREAIAAIFLHKVATGENLYQTANGQNRGCYTYTRVKETLDDCFPLIVGGFASSGLSVDIDYLCLPYVLGIAAFRKFESN